ncbi:MAG: DUF3010 family protein [Bacteroidota bacterium]|nr:DUF3010 family protein [Bacteroidota bacterium]
MKVIGIDIDKSKAIFYALEKNATGKLTNLTGDFKYLILTDDTDNSRVREFQSTVHTFFDEIQPDRIVILKRQTKGRFKSAPLSFKIEGLIQCYTKIDIEFLPPITLSTFYKKNIFNHLLEHNYQETAAKLAYYLVSLA